MNGPIHATAAKHALIGSIDDRINVLCDDVAFDHLQPGHGVVRRSPLARQPVI